MPRLESWTQQLRSIAAIDEAWGAVRRRQLHRGYQQRREYYTQKAPDWKYDESQVVHEVRAQMRRRGYSIVERPPGEVHTFAFVPNLGWHAALLPDLRELGPLTVFDYAAHGYTCNEFHRRGTSAITRRREMLDRFWKELTNTHRQHPVDWVFVYASGVEIGPHILQRITDELGIPTVGMCLDDKQSWTGPAMGEWRLGQIDIAPAFDLCWTSARVACQWYYAEGGRAIYLPEGFDQTFYRPLALPRDIPISFIGGAYGFRPSLMRHLRRCGLPVHTFGPGWNTRSVWGDEQIEIINRSVINLGSGGIGYSESLTNVKTRDFEIPGTGGGMYLTTFNSDLANHFHVGDEIVCYHNREELVELARYYLRHADEAHQIAQRARKRCLAEHRWLHRYQHICRALGILPQNSARTTERCQPTDFAARSA